MTVHLTKGKPDLHEGHFDCEWHVQTHFSGLSVAVSLQFWTRCPNFISGEHLQPNWPIYWPLSILMNYKIPPKHCTLTGMDFYKDLFIKILVLQLTHSLSLYNAAAFRPRCDGRVWSSATRSAAEKHISGVYVAHLLRLMLTNVKSKQVIFTGPCANYFQSGEVI